MFCTNCGHEIDDNAVICVHCGVPVKKQIKANNICGNLTNYNQPKITNSFGIAGFVVGLLSIWLGVFFCIPAILGLVFSIIGMANTKKCNSANGLAVAGLVLSIFAVLLWSTVWVCVFITEIMPGIVY